VTKTRLPITWTRDGDDWVCQLTVEQKVSLRINQDAITSEDAKCFESALRCIEHSIDEQTGLVLDSMVKALADSGWGEVLRTDE
jgi:hypothetical protein